jgi:uncharacterized membrane protein
VEASCYSAECGHFRCECCCLQWWWRCLRCCWSTCPASVCCRCCTAAGLHIARLQGYTLHGCRVTHCTAAGLHIARLQGYTLHGCRVTRCTAAGLHIARLQGYTLHGCRVTHCTAAGLHIARLQGYTLHGCRVTRCMAAGFTLHVCCSFCMPSNDRPASDRHRMQSWPEPSFILRQLCRSSQKTEL